MFPEPVLHIVLASQEIEAHSHVQPHLLVPEFYYA